MKTLYSHRHTMMIAVDARERIYTALFICYRFLRKSLRGITHVINIAGIPISNRVPQITSIVFLMLDTITVNYSHRMKCISASKINHSNVKSGKEMYSKLYIESIEK